MKRIVLVLAAGVAVISCAGLFSETGNGVSVQKEIKSSIDVIYTQTPGTQSLTLTCDENLVDYYMIAVDNGTLVVKTEPSVWVKPKAKTYLTVNSAVLDGVRLSGSGDVHIKGPVVADGAGNARHSQAAGAGKRRAHRGYGDRRKLQDQRDVRRYQCVWALYRESCGADMGDSLGNWLQMARVYCETV